MFARRAAPGHRRASIRLDARLLLGGSFFGKGVQFRPPVSALLRIEDPLISGS
jgi:hypothetical protein